MKRLTLNRKACMGPWLCAGCVVAAEGLMPTLEEKGYIVVNRWAEEHNSVLIDRMVYACPCGAVELVDD